MNGKSSERDKAVMNRADARLAKENLEKGKMAIYVGKGKKLGRGGSRGSICYSQRRGSKKALAWKGKEGSRPPMKEESENKTRWERSKREMERVEGKKPMRAERGQRGTVREEERKCM